MFSFSHHSDIKPCLLKYAEFRWNSPEKNIVVSVFVCFRSVRWASDRRPSTRTYNLLCFFGDDSACTGVETIMSVLNWLRACMADVCTACAGGLSVDVPLQRRPTSPEGSVSCAAEKLSDAVQRELERDFVVRALLDGGDVTNWRRSLPSSAPCLPLAAAAANDDHIGRIGRYFTCDDDDAGSHIIPASASTVLQYVCNNCTMAAVHSVLSQSHQNIILSFRRLYATLRTNEWHGDGECILVRLR